MENLDFKFDYKIQILVQMIKNYILIMRNYQKESGFLI